MSELPAATDVSAPTEPHQKKRRITRRQFLIVAGASGAAALVGLRVLGLPYARLRLADYLDSSGGPPIGVKAAPTAWFEILPDNRVRLFLPKVEMGQGVHTALAQAAADELEAAWDNLEVSSAATGQGLDDPVGTSASNSVSSLYLTLRQAGATVRQMLRAEGARQLGRPVEDAAAEQGYVFIKNDPAVRRSYGEIMAAAPALTVPEQPAPLKTDAEFRYIGKPMTRVDLRAKVLGQATYGIDVRLPGMAYGAVAHPLTVEGKLKRAAAGRAESMPGVIKVVLDQQAGFAGVVAESREQAYAALDALDVEWDAGHLWQQAEVEQAVTAGGAGGVVIQKEGTVRSRLRGNAAVEAEYRVPMAYHGHFEPLTAVADVGAGAARIYTSTQAAVSVRGDVADGARSEAGVGGGQPAVPGRGPGTQGGDQSRGRGRPALASRRPAGAPGLEPGRGLPQQLRAAADAPHPAGQPHGRRPHRSAGARTGQRQGGAALPACYRRRGAGARLRRVARRPHRLQYPQPGDHRLGGRPAVPDRLVARPGPAAQHLRRRVLHGRGRRRGRDRSHRVATAPPAGGEPRRAAAGGAAGRSRPGRLELACACRPGPGCRLLRWTTARWSPT